MFQPQPSTLTSRVPGSLEEAGVHVETAEQRSHDIEMDVTASLARGWNATSNGPLLHACSGLN